MFEKEIMVFSWHSVSLFELEWERNLQKFYSGGFQPLTVDSACLPPLHVALPVRVDYNAVKNTQTETCENSY